MLYLHQLICKPCLTMRFDLTWSNHDIPYWTGKQGTSKGASKLWLLFSFCSCCYKLFVRLQLVFMEAVAFQGEVSPLLNTSLSGLQLFYHFYQVVGLMQYSKTSCVLAIASHLRKLFNTYICMCVCIYTYIYTSASSQHNELSPH